MTQLFLAFIAANPQQRGKNIGVTAQLQAMVDWAQKESAHNKQVKRLYLAFRANALSSEPKQN
jgi:hypothetical protein